MEDLNLFKNRRTSVRRSARAGIALKGVVDPKIRFAQYRAPQLTLKPLFFEVPLQEPDPLFLGRHWLIKHMEEVISKLQITCRKLTHGNKNHISLRFQWNFLSVGKHQLSMLSVSFKLLPALDRKL